MKSKLPKSQSDCNMLSLIRKTSARMVHEWGLARLLVGLEPTAPVYRRFSRHTHVLLNSPLNRSGTADAKL
jgi:hypothetical protein